MEEEEVEKGEEIRGESIEEEQDEEVEEKADEQGGRLRRKKRFHTNVIFI